VGERGDSEEDGTVVQNTYVSRCMDCGWRESSQIRPGGKEDLPRTGVARIRTITSHMRTTLTAWAVCT